MPKSNAIFIEIKEQWIRLYKSYNSGLFRFYDFSVYERTNSKMELHFGKEKMKFISRSGKANVSRQIRVRGNFELKISYSHQNELINILNSLEGTYSPDEVKKSLKQLQERQKKELYEWQTKITGKSALLNLYGSEEKRKENLD